MFSITQSIFTLQKSDIFSLMPPLSGSSALAMMTFGEMPMERSSLTKCCVGFDLCSPEHFKNGIKVT